jgi:hypothetical protein
MSRNVMTAFRPVFAFRKLFSSDWGNPDNALYGLVYALKDKNVAYVGWAMNQMCGQNTWFMPGGDYSFLKFKHGMDLQHAKSIANVAILFSGTSKLLYASNIAESLGIAELLNDAHIQYNFISDQSMTFEQLKKYAVLVLPSTDCLSVKQISAIEQFVKAGGTLLATGTAGRKNGFGVKCKSFPLQKLLGVVPKTETPLISAAGTIKYNNSEYPYKGYTYAVTAVNNSVKTLAVENFKQQSATPLFTLNSYGKGKAYYLACRLGAANYEAESTPGYSWKYQKNQALATLFDSIFATVLGKNSALKAIAIPQDLLVSLFRQKNKNGTQLLVQLLNVSGADKLKPGMLIKAGNNRPFEKAFPELKHDLVFELQTTSKIKSGYIVSPDYTGKRSIKITYLPNNKVRITINKGDVKAYSIVYLTLDTP